MAKKQNSISPVVERLVTRLAERRSIGPTHYPIALNTLLSEVLEPEDHSIAPKLLRNQQFKKAIVRGHPKAHEAPVALAGDVEQLAGSTALFEFSRTRMASEPPWVLSEVAKQIAAPLRKGFLAAFKTRAERGELDGVVATAEDRIAHQLLRALNDHFQSPLAAPTTLASLAVAAGLNPSRDQSRIKRAATRPAFAEQVCVVRDRVLDAPLVPKSRAAQLLTSGITLEYLLRASRTANKHVLLVPEIAKKMNAQLRRSFEQSVFERLDADQLPEGVAAVRDGKKRKLFLIDDLEPPSLRRRLEETNLEETNMERLQSQGRPLLPPGPPNGFADAFTKAFLRLDSASGSYNQVSLYALRQALHDWPRDAFDSHLMELRRTGQYSLSGLQNRFGISAEEQAAGIEEGGHLLIYVSRKR